MKEWLEYAAVLAILKTLGALPRGLARGAAAAMASIFFAMIPKFRRTAEFNLHPAFPGWDAGRTTAVTLGLVRIPG